MRSGRLSTTGRQRTTRGVLLRRAYFVGSRNMAIDDSLFIQQGNTAALRGHTRAPASLPEHLSRIKSEGLHAPPRRTYYSVYPSQRVLGVPKVTRRDRTMRQRRRLKINLAVVSALILTATVAGPAYADSTRSESPTSRR